MKKNKILLILVSYFALTACQSVKEGLTGSKSENSDEFLVQKKNPLVLPPKYLELPKPKETIKENQKTSLNQDNTDLQKIFGIEKESTDLLSVQNGDAEEFVLRNINNN
jgi:hypothetical protein|tara:strand:- start:266 stop:592 length:327 start_codon:yes stop_codon:yes gene_type:complete